MRTSRESDAILFKVIAIVLAVIFVIASGGLALRIWKQKQGKVVVSRLYASSIKYEGKEYILNNNIETLLVIGLDKFEGIIDESSYTNDKQADFILLLVVDNENKTYTAMHINRDTMAEVNVLGVNGQKVDSAIKQISLAHTYGNGNKVSCRNVADSVSALFQNVTISNYASVTMDAVPVINDMVGGVTVEILDDFSDVDSTLVKGEKVQLMGQHALNYVRSRYGMEDSTNSARMLRQRQYLNALFEKIKERAKEDERFVADASVKMSEYLVSNRSATRLQQLFEKINEYKFEGIKNLEGEYKKGEFMEFYPDKDSVKKTMVELFYKEEK